jgi:hypothetical protein
MYSRTPAGSGRPGRRRARASRAGRSRRPRSGGSSSRPARTAPARGGLQVALEPLELAGVVAGAPHDDRARELQDGAGLAPARKIGQVVAAEQQIQLALRRQSQAAGQLAQGVDRVRGPASARARRGDRPARLPRRGDLEHAAAGPRRARARAPGLCGGRARRHPDDVLQVEGGDAERATCRWPGVHRIEGAAEDPQAAHAPEVGAPERRSPQPSAPACPGAPVNRAAGGDSSRGCRARAGAPRGRCRALHVALSFVEPRTLPGAPSLTLGRGPVHTSTPASAGATGSRRGSPPPLTAFPRGRTAPTFA